MSGATHRVGNYERSAMARSRKEHKQVTVRWKGMEAEVDEELAPLILTLWKNGIVTTNSCQENRPGIAWIEFLTPEDARLFLNKVVEYPTKEEVDGPFWETLYGRIVGYGSE